MVYFPCKWTSWSIIIEIETKKKVNWYTGGPPCWVVYSLQFINQCSYCNNVFCWKKYIWILKSHYQRKEISQKHSRCKRPISLTQLCDHKFDPALLPISLTQLCYPSVRPSSVTHQFNLALWPISLTQLCDP